MARSFALRNDDIKSGISIGTKALILVIKLPLSRSAPLDFCALLILLNSSKRVGINRSAIDIIIAISCTFIWKIFSGFIILSKPSVRSVGEVVKVRTPLISTISITLAATNTALFMPASVISIKPHLNIGSPLP